MTLHQNYHTCRLKAFKPACDEYVTEFEKSGPIKAPGTYKNECNNEIMRILIDEYIRIQIEISFIK